MWDSLAAICIDMKMPPPPISLSHLQITLKPKPLQKNMSADSKIGGWGGWGPGSLGAQDLQPVMQVVRFFSCAMIYSAPILFFLRCCDCPTAASVVHTTQNPLCARKPPKMYQKPPFSYQKNPLLPSPEWTPQQKQYAPTKATFRSAK